MVHVEDDACREIAKELEQQYPRWIVIFGTFTREFLCLPRFAAPPGLRVVAIYPKRQPSGCRAWSGSAESGKACLNGMQRKGLARRDY
jgi:hypothetical protein